MGDVVNVMNIQSKRTLQGTVTGPGRVSVSATTPRIAVNAAVASADPSDQR
jgi:flagella basal body P-ring formation protein FlgA